MFPIVRSAGFVTRQLRCISNWSYQILELYGKILCKIFPVKKDRHAFGFAPVQVANKHQYPRPLWYDCLARHRDGSSPNMYDWALQHRLTTVNILKIKFENAPTIETKVAEFMVTETNTIKCFRSTIRDAYHYEEAEKVREEQHECLQQVSVVHHKDYSESSYQCA